MDYYNKQKKLINNWIKCYLKESFNSRFSEAANYFTYPDGHRYRSIISLEIYKALGGNENSFQKGVVGIEFIHHASLVLDDLPCMDDADTRKWKPTVHVKYGESTAILCALYLYEKGRNLLVDEIQKHCPEKFLEIESLVHKILKGMLMGQELDLRKNKTEKELLKSMLLKNGLFYLSCTLPAYLLRRDDKKDLVDVIGKDLAVSYQLYDDLRDKQDSDITGKDIEKDAGKNTYMYKFGIEKTQEELRIRKNRIIKNIKLIGKEEKLEELISFILTKPS